MTEKKEAQGETATKQRATKTPRLTGKKLCWALTRPWAASHYHERQENSNRRRNQTVKHQTERAGTQTCQRQETATTTAKA